MRILLPIVLCSAGAAAAQDAPPPGALACSGCHGPGSTLRLENLSADEIAEAVTGFRDGTREATLMNRLAAGFTDAEIAQIAAWIAGEGGQ